MPYKGKTVLVVDDSESAREFMQIFLQEAGLKVFLANDGESALKTLKQEQNNVDLVITDYSMPRMGDGVRLLHDIRKTNSHIPVILMSGNEFEPHDKIHQEGFSSVMVKASSHKVIIATVSSIMA